MQATLKETANSLMVDRDDTPFIGVSGRQVASIERGVELTIHEERGPYTIVCWGNRNGYVPTDHLVSLADFNPSREEDDIAEPAAPSKRSANPFRLLFPWTQREA